MDELISEFAQKSRAERFFWGIISGLIIIGPICLFPYLFNNKNQD